MWNHNIHFHNYMLRQLPKKINRVLDVGCGSGLLAWKLSNISDTVDAIDLDEMILKEALNQHNASNIYYKQADFLQTNLSEDYYDIIVSIASIHHMDLETALNKMKLLLRQSGKLLILGLYQEKTILDYIYSMISVPLNFFYLYWYRKSNLTPNISAPTRTANLSLNRIKSVANTVIPGFKVQRHLFWRYSLIWQKP